MREELGPSMYDKHVEGRKDERAGGPGGGKIRYSVRLFWISTATRVCRQFCMARLGKKFRLTHDYLDPRDN